MMHQRGLVVVKVICERALPESAPHLSTADPFSARLEAVEKKRLRLGISRRELAELSGVSERAMTYAVSGIKAMRPSTLRRLERALSAWRAASPAPDITAAAYRGLLVAFAAECGVPADRLLAADPRHERGAIARARMRAVYLMVTELGFTMTAVAELVGVTKQAVSKSMRDIEDERDDPAIDALIARVARRVAGRG